MRIALIALILLCLGACGAVGFPGVYRINVEQGNIITQEMVDQLKPGMSRRQVRFILGTPLVEDSFNQDRWEYAYVIRNGAQVILAQELTVYFEGEQLTRFHGDFSPSAEPEAEEPELEESAEPEVEAAQPEEAAG